MNVDDLVGFYGTQTAAGAAIGISKQSVSLWVDCRIPTDYQIKWEQNTCGKLKADLPKEIRTGKYKRVTSATV